MINFLPFILISIIWSSAFLAAVSPMLLLHSESTWRNYLYLGLAPFIFGFTFLTVAAVLSRWAQRGIINGTFPREPFHSIYLLRRIYGTCWTQIFYFKPLYAIALSIPMLKKYLFRAFGYKHDTAFTVYPDTWIRDLPTLNIGAGAYLSNRATIGTNICLSDGQILVDGIHVAEKGLVGHLSVLAPGVKVGPKVEVGVSATIAIRVQLKESSKIHPCCMINHGVVIGENTKVGTMSYIGLKSTLGPQLNVPAGANIPAGTMITTQEEMDKFFHSETLKIEDHVGNLRHIFQTEIRDEFKV